MILQRKLRSRAGGWLAAALMCVPVFLSAANVPPGFSETLLASNLDQPTAMEIAPDGRIFICQQGGRLRVVKNGALLPDSFMTVTTEALGERGLLGVAFDPGFATNQFVYVYHTVPGSSSPFVPSHNRVSRFTAAGDTVVPGSGVVVLDLENLSFASNHNGGAIHFGPDGKLYVSVGENANPANAQTLTNRLGKILRLDPDGAIPADNPFFLTATNAGRAIWAMGLRNPFTFAFQPGTGRLIINDVGQNTWEEINEGVAGANYGWPVCEGFCVPTNSNYRDPLFRYGHFGGAPDTIGCSIAGGAFYNPVSRQFPPNFTGSYFFADYCGGWIRRLDPNRTNTVSTFVTGLAQPVDLKVGVDGTLYYLTRARAGGGAGTLGAVQFTNTPPRFVKGPDQVVLEDASPQTVPNWATNISAGPPPESWQTLRFVVTPDHPELFALAPAINPAGTLTYTPASNANGVSLVTVLLQDDGGTVKGSRDTSPPQSFQIAITPVNDPPVADASATPGRVVSPNNVNARVALDGSRSSDIENDPLQFLWFADGSPLALTNGRVTVATLYVGTHDLLLRVDDGSDSSSSHVTVQIITAAAAVSELTVSVQKLNVSKLAEALSRLGAAKKAFEDGAFASGVKQLQSFQKSIRGLVVSKVLEPAVADRLILAAQQLIEVIGQGKDANPKFVSCKCDPDGVIRMEFSGAVGLQWLVQSSEDLQHWETIGLAAEGADGTFAYAETAGARCRFYRVVLP